MHFYLFNLTLYFAVININIIQICFMSTAYWRVVIKNPVRCSLKRRGLIIIKVGGL